MTVFNSWKEREEDATYSTYVKGQQTYQPRVAGKCMYMHDKNNWQLYSIILCVISPLLYILLHRNQGTILFCMLSQWQVSCQQRSKKDKRCTSSPKGISKA